jgi:hypothetical protein
MGILRFRHQEDGRSPLLQRLEQRFFRKLQQATTNMAIFQQSGRFP